MVPTFPADPRLHLHSPSSHRCSTHLGGDLLQQSRRWHQWTPRPQQGCWGVYQWLVERKCCFRTRDLEWVFEMLPPRELQINVVDCQPVHNEATPSQTPVLGAICGIVEFDGNKRQHFRTSSWLPRPRPVTWHGRQHLPLLSGPRLGHRWSGKGLCFSATSSGKHRAQRWSNKSLPVVAATQPRLHSALAPVQRAILRGYLFVRVAFSKQENFLIFYLPSRDPGSGNSDKIIIKML